MVKAEQRLAAAAGIDALEFFLKNLEATDRPDVYREELQIAAGEDADDPPIVVEARRRYGWVRETLGRVRERGCAHRGILARAARFMNRPWPGTIGLFVVMLVVFQAVFAWATPLMDAIDGTTAALADAAKGLLSIDPSGAVTVLCTEVDGASNASMRFSSRLISCTNGVRKWPTMTPLSRSSSQRVSTRIGQAPSRWNGIEIP